MYSAFKMKTPFSIYKECFESIHSCLTSKLSKGQVHSLELVQKLEARLSDLIQPSAIVTLSELLTDLMIDEIKNCETGKKYSNMLNHSSIKSKFKEKIN